MGRPRTHVATSASAALASAALVAIAACNALTGASDLELCGTEACGSTDAGSSNVTPEAGTFEGGGTKDASASPDGSMPDPDAAIVPDAAPDSGTGCKGAIACERVVFVTSTMYTGNLGGTNGADLECQKAASSEGAHPRVKGRTVRAWLSTSGAPVSTRLPHGTQAYRLPSGQSIATSWDDLTDGQLLTGLREDETGQVQTGQSWTGTQTNGSTSLGATCLEWVSNVGNVKGQRGNVGGSLGGWTEASQDDCAVPHRLYCFEY